MGHGSLGDRENDGHESYPPITVSAANNYLITTSEASHHPTHRPQHLRTIASCRMMRAMDGPVRPTMTGCAISVISITETTMITVPAGPEGRD